MCLDLIYGDIHRSPKIQELVRFGLFFVLIGNIFTIQGERKLILDGYLGGRGTFDIFFSICL